MTEQEITEGNNLIAEFMGLSYCEKYRYEGWYKNHEHNHRICDYDGLKYSTSWDWLMEVVEKIEGLKLVFEFNINWDSVYKTHHCEITPALKDTFNVFRNNVKASKIQAVYLTVIDFIEWHNENK